ncbi:MAG TPA: RdgB/HAM1 family non-canonical purine NTP pyrophosphatase [Bdellovibrionales bacterium]|nr:RdgB/HAM1 family non-canonical purine NTP pyrophosphatase [Bdellovibrionales bacterium]
MSRALWISTTNKGKLNEFRNLMNDRVEIHSVAELNSYFAPPETGKTFVENARIKAKTLKAIKPGVWVVADDSGLEVEGLGGLPGIHSARYAGDKASDAENVAKLLKMLQIRSPGNRKAQFRCVLVAYDPTGAEHVIEGGVVGAIASTARGTVGFGYDPAFIPEGHDKTFAELGLAVKNQISHRAKAIRELLALIERFSQ